jgi:hypothetical protein
MTDQERASRTHDAGNIEPEQHERRNFLLGLGKWSKAVIGGVVLGGLLAPGREVKAWGWANRDSGKGSWVNFRGGWGWGPGWSNRSGGWYNRPGGWGPGWYNRPGGWYNRPWHNHGGWYNGPGWGGGSWVNRY